MTDNTLKNAVKAQYTAHLKMLHNAVSTCTDALWVDDSYVHQFWWVTYHVLFYADCFISPDPDTFVPWDKHIEELEGGNAMDPREIKAADMPGGHNAYTRQDILQYCETVISRVDHGVECIELDAGSGFSRLPFSRLELHLYALRHIAHHTGQLIERIRQNLDLPVDWAVR